MYYNVVTPVIFLKYLNIQALSPPSPPPISKYIKYFGTD